MNVPIRTTANGTEYWDSEAKKTIFVPAGMRPAFEVTESPTTMLHKGETVKPLVEPVFNLEGMTATQLREYAEENNIEVPGNLKKAETIREHIEEQLAADAE
ncbi:Rho termination factor N-terminal domain-containing protein [Lysinibacillus boronitolerans]|uniref:Rho termination factor N-terminal domain-containing protein n=1 Tax=Lysinibacillus boronitolerans TaxID=309788 RepID=UPI0021627D59|nr:Rho termination factor N-terminal domain-containing protein [Lysinibacillus boronitolerans]MCS1392988.1 Rho termination factor N-terminal domain-containing protein [Lysinibacillus boronitolerans]